MPKYAELYQQLRLAILRGEYAPDERLPSENALALRHQVSRITSKRALNELAAADLVYRVQGGGTFVKPHASTTSRELLLVLPFPGQAEFGDYQSGVMATLQNTTWRLNAVQNDAFLAKPADAIAEQFAGVIYYPQNLATELPHLLALFARRVPLVLLDKRPAALAIPSVVSDNVAGGALACRHLLATGHTRIAFYSEAPFWQDFTGTVSDRFCGYLNAYQNALPAGATPLRWAQVLNATAPAQRAAWLHAQGITGVIAENDLAAVTLQQQLQVADPAMAASIAIVGFDDLPVATTSTPALTTVVQDFEQIGADAVEALLVQINNPTRQYAASRVVPVHLVKRASTANHQPTKTPKIKE